MADIRLQDIDKIYDNGAHAVHDLNLEVSDGEFLVLVGPSGCGKSTALRMIAGLEPITDGELFISERRVNDIEPKNRDLAMVFQNYALYPHMTVAENIAFPLRVARASRKEQRAKAEEVAALLELSDHLDKKPGQLSGGQRQRVAMGRAIIRQPAAFLMDEPLSNLDAKLRVQMRSEISRLQRRLGVTTIYVTHDQVEAMTMGDRVAVLKDGWLQQVDTPQNLYDRPANLFVASFIGSPAMNLHEARIEDDVLHLGPHRLSIPTSVFQRRPALQSLDGRKIAFGIRPEDVEDATLTDDPRFSASITCEVELTEALGSEIVVHFVLDAPTVEVDNPDLDPESAPVHTVGRLDPRSKATAGEDISVVLNLENAHFFDLETGTSIWD
jgi:multiple sugar transport system ATP-binding protein